MAKTKSIQQDEYSGLIKILSFRLPYKMKIIGYVGAITLFLFLLASKLFMEDKMSILTKDLLRYLVLLFMLIASLSKDRFEDEFNNHVRFQSYVLAFVCAAGYSISLPLVATVFDMLLTTVTGDGTSNFHEVSSFEVLFILMGFNLLFFETLKRFGREE